MANYTISEIGIPPAVAGFSSSILYQYIRNINTYQFSLAGNISINFDIGGVTPNVTANSCLFALSSIKTPTFSFLLQGGTQSIGNVSYLSMGLNKTYAVSAFSLGIRRGQVGQLYPRGEHAKLKLPY